MVDQKTILRHGLLIFKVAIVAAMIVVAVIAVSGSYSAVLLLSGGDLGGDGDGDGPPLFIFPEEGDMSTTLVGDRITISAPLGFKNTGFIPVEDLVLDLSVDYRGKRLLEGRNDIGTIPGGSSRVQTITFSGSIGDMVDEGLGNVLYHDLETRMRVAVGARYVYGLVRFSLALSFDQPWSAPVNISMDMDNVRFTIDNETTATMTVPVTIRTAEWLSGRVESVLNISAYSFSPVPLGQVVFSSDLGDEIEEHVNISIPLSGLNNLATHDSIFRLSGDVVLTVGGRNTTYALSRSLPWRAPLRDVSISVNKMADDVQIDAHFSNALDEGKAYTITFLFYSGATFVDETGRTEFQGPGDSFMFHENLWGVASVDRYVCTIGWEDSGPFYVEGGLL